MGNVLNSSISSSPIGKGTRRKRESDDSDAEREEIQESILNTPKRRKLTTTSEYIYETLYRNGQKSDVTICALGKDWKLHRVYLCQSGYFASMFSNQWKESEMTTINIDIPDDNIDREALDIAFGSLYRDDVTIKPTTVTQVLAAATLFSLDGLIQQCTAVMIETVSVKTVCDYHLASVMYGQIVLTNVCRSWLEQNLMLCTSIELLREVDPELMTEIVLSPDLLVMQVEMDVYSMLKKWLFLQFETRWAGHMKDVIYEAETWFRAKDSTKEFLETDQGRPYQAPFKSLRFSHMINDLSSTKIIEEDNIIPREWLYPVYRRQWLQMLRVEQGHDRGPSKPEQVESRFSSCAVRCGRILQKEGQYCWRWTGYNFGIDLLVSFTSRLILIKRNTLSQQFPGAVGMQNKRHIVYKMRVSSFNKLGQVTYSKCTGLKHLSLGKDQEQVILAVDRKAEFPLHISCSYMVYTPREDLDQSAVGSTLAGNENLDDSTDSSSGEEASSHDVSHEPAGDVFHLAQYL